MKEPNPKVTKITEFEKTIHLHGYQEIKDFFEAEYIGHEKELEDFVNSLLEGEDNTHLGLISEMKSEGILYLRNRKVVSVIIHHN